MSPYSINAKFITPDRPSSPYVFNKETLGFRLDSKEEISLFRDQGEPVHQNIESFFDYALALVGTITEAQQNSHLHGDDWQRTIYIDTLGAKTTQFDLADDMKKNLVQSGRDGVIAYFDWFDKTSTAVNK